MNKAKENLEKIKIRISGLDNQIDGLKQKIESYEDEINYTNNILLNYSENSTDYLLSLQAVYEFEFEIDCLQRKIQLYKKFRKYLAKLYNDFSHL